MKTIENLTNGSEIKVAGILGKITVETLSDFCKDGHTTIAECEKRDKEANRKTQYAWTMQHASILTASYPGKDEAHAKEMAARAAAPVVENGDVLVVDGVGYTAKILGNYSDPVYLTRN